MTNCEVQLKHSNHEQNYLWIKRRWIMQHWRPDFHAHPHNEYIRNKLPNLVKQPQFGIVILDYGFPIHSNSNSRPQCVYRWCPHTNFNNALVACNICICICTCTCMYEPYSVRQKSCAGAEGSRKQKRKLTSANRCGCRVLGKVGVSYVTRQANT